MANGLHGGYKRLHGGNFQKANLKVEFPGFVVANGLHGGYKKVTRRKFSEGKFEGGISRIPGGKRVTWRLQKGYTEEFKSQ